MPCNLKQWTEHNYGPGIASLTAVEATFDSYSVVLVTVAQSQRKEARRRMEDPGVRPDINTRLIDLLTNSIEISLNISIQAEKVSDHEGIVVASISGRFVVKPLI